MKKKLFIFICLFFGAFLLASPLEAKTEKNSKGLPSHTDKKAREKAENPVKTGSKNKNKNTVAGKNRSSLPLENLPDPREFAKKDFKEGLRFVMVILLFTLVPALFISMTAFTRILIVLAFFKKALSAQEIPPSTVVFGLALILTAVVMAPWGKVVYSKALLPYHQNKIGGEEALQKAMIPLKDFMLSQARDRELLLFLKVQKTPVPEKREALPLEVIFPAFVVSEIKRAFEMGILLYLPFLLIDMLVSLALLGLGMTSIPHHTVAFPLKISLFVAVDGWNMLVMGLLQSFAV